MDARELLRRYLEQRREMGESELVLDSLSVEEALRLLGAHVGNRAARKPSSDAARELPRAREAEPAPEWGANSADWREALRKAGGEPEQQPAARPAPGSPPLGSAPSAKGQTPNAPLGQPPAFGGHPAEHQQTPAASTNAPITVGGSGEELFGGALSHLETLGDVARTVASCTRCPLYATAKNPVPGEGNPEADMMIVGEAPGANEDESGRPFVGQAGQLLTKILAAIKLSREDVFIANVLKHRPPGNRNPLPDEVVACSPYLLRQIELVQPKVILALGTFAAQTLLDTKLGIGKLRGVVHRYHGVPLIVTYHPAALLRNQAWKRPTWEDVQLARRVLDRASAGA